MAGKLKRKDAVPVVEVKRIWRDDAVIHPDGTREGAWVECKVYQAEPVPETREGYVRGPRRHGATELTHEGVERLADLWYRFVERETFEGKQVVGDEHEV